MASFSTAVHSLPRQAAATLFKVTIQRMVLGELAITSVLELLCQHQHQRLQYYDQQVDAGLWWRGALTKSGTGTLTLSGGNSYSGGTTVAAGILKAGSNSAFGNNGAAIVVNNGASLDINGATLDGYTQNIQIAGTGQIVRWAHL